MGWAVCYGESCIPCLLDQATLPHLSCWRGAASSSGNSSSSLVGHGTHGEQGEAPHQNQPWSCQGAQALGNPEVRRWGVLGTWGPTWYSRCWPT